MRGLFDAATSFEPSLKTPGELIQRIDRAAGSRATYPSLARDAVSRRDYDCLNGGYATLRAQNGFAVTRAARFRHRPAQADMLHVDIWWRGENMAIDPGTYSYNAAPPWNNPFAHTSYHNTVTVDGLDQMERAGRFLWLPWLNGKSHGRNVRCQGDASCWNGEHDGYRRLTDPMMHRRGLVRLGPDHWLVIDALAGHQSHSFRLHWLLLDAEYEIDHDRSSMELRTNVGRYRLATTSSVSSSRFNVTRAASDSAIGWRSTHYHSREPALSVSLESSSTNVLFATLLGPDAEQPQVRQNQIHVQGSDWTAEVSLNLNMANNGPLVSSIFASGLLSNDAASKATRPHHQISELRQCTSC